jgi:hypothetical protein
MSSYYLQNQLASQEGLFHGVSKHIKVYEVLSSSSGVLCVQTDGHNGFSRHSPRMRTGLTNTEEGKQYKEEEITVA